MVPKSAGAMGSGPATQRPLEVTRGGSDGASVAATAVDLTTATSVAAAPDGIRRESLASAAGDRGG